MEKIIDDFITDLSITFPEKQEQWTLLSVKSPEKSKELMEYFSTVYPERFFDILYQNEEIFVKSNVKDQEEINTCFLPGVDFTELFHSNISENTKKTIWKYLQLILFQVIENVKSKSAFGDSANLFQGIDENELQEKMKETMEGLKVFFQPDDSTQEQSHNETEHSQGETGGKEPNIFENLFKNMDSENLQDHLKNLMGGKIGGLVKELVEEMKDEFSEFEKEMGDIHGNPSIQEVMKRLMKNPAKMMGLMKKMTEKVKTKMQQGGNEEEFMKETADIFKQMGGKDGFMKMFEEFKRSAPGGGKNMKIDKNALDRMQKQYETKERMKRNIAEKKKTAQPPINSVIEMDADGNRVFRLVGGEKQEQSTKPEDIDALMNQFGLNDPPPTKKQSVSNEVKDSKKKGKKAKSKK